MIPLLEKMRSLLRQDESSEAVAATAIIMNPRGDDFFLLLVKRAINPSDPWSGDIAFPGGKKHTYDKDLRETVMRETMEETGIDLKNSLLIGMMDAMHSNLKKGMLVQPFVFLSESSPDVKLSEELCSFFWVPISELEESRSLAKIRGLEAPAFKVRGEAIWGLTYRMIDNLIKIINEVKGKPVS